MINSIKQAIVNRLTELYPGYTIYDEDIPQNFKSKSFLITVINQDYIKRMDTKYKSLISFDIAYFSDKGKEDIKNDCLDTQIGLLRNFDLVGTYRALNKQSNITDNVLHFTFDVNYSEMRNESSDKMQEQHTNLRMEV